MKAFISYIFVLSAIVYFQTYEAPKPVYENSYKSQLPQRVISHINESVAKSCQTQNYKIAGENIEKSNDRFTYEIRLTTNPLEGGRVVVQELHSGEVLVQNIECPGKNGRWYSYTHPMQPTRQIAAN